MLVSAKASRTVSEASRREAARDKRTLLAELSRSSIVHFVPHARDGHLRNGTTLPEATRLALRSAKKLKIGDYNRTDLNLNVVGALLSPTLHSINVVLVNDGVSAPEELAVFSDSPTPDEKEGLRVVNQPNSVELVLTRPSTTYKTIQPKGGASIAVRTKSNKVRELQLYYVYDFSNIQADDSRGPRDVVLRIPLYSPAAASLLVDRALPFAELEVRALVTPGKAGAPTLRAYGASIRIHLIANLHNVHLTHDVAMPNLSHVNANKEAVRRDDGPVSTAISNVASVVYGSIKQYISATGSTKPFSCSISHNDRVVSSANGTSRYRLGELGNVFVALEVLRQVGTSLEGRSLQERLADPATLRAMLQASGNEEVYRGLEKLYANYGRTPSLLELLTHTSGLPNVASVDAMGNEELLNAMLPIDASEASPELRSNHLAALLAERTQLVAASTGPGSVVHHSQLGYTVLAMTVRGQAAAFKTLFTELGMDETRVDAYPHKKQAVVPQFSGTTADLARFVADVERARADPSAFPMLAESLQTQYAFNGELYKDTPQYITLGGWSVSRVKIRVPGEDANRLSLSVFNVRGEQDDQTVLLFWIPALHIGAAFGVDMPMSTLFSIKDNRRIHHLLKQVLHDSLESFSVDSAIQIDRAADALDTVMAPYPPQHAEYILQGQLLSDTATGAWKDILEKHKLFRTGVWYPALPAYQRIFAPENASKSAAQALEGLPFIRIYRTLTKDVDPTSSAESSGSSASESSSSNSRNEKSAPEPRYMLEDSRSPVVFSMAFHSQGVVKEGRPNVGKESGLSRGHFALVSINGHGVTEAVTLHIIPGEERVADGKKTAEKIIAVKYGGQLYVSDVHLNYCKIRIDDERMKRDQQLRQARQVDRVKGFMPWKLASGAVTVQDIVNADTAAVSDPPRIEGPIGWGLAGLGAGLLGGALLFGPRVYYPPPYRYYYW